ncbi:MAG: lamin tail domain-containing protein [Chitinophagaceae bacterium]|nr:MAG: lamin tail domain-containing protein [Chitinophagaceae bacterium]
MWCKLIFRCYLVCAVLFGGKTVNGQPHPVIITEVYPDPDNKAGLPVAEFIELKNVSANTINLKSWRITDGSSTATINKELLLKADSFIVICPNSAAGSFMIEVNVVGVSSFPSLNNDADLISLLDDKGKNIHTIYYNNEWHSNDLKKSGGWTLEMIDFNNPCGGKSNWASSVHPAGGTPGAVNSVYAPNPDEQPPALLRTYLADPRTLVAVFDEPLDSITAMNHLMYRLVLPGAQVNGVSFLTRMHNEVVIHLSEVLMPEIINTLTVTQLRDCAGNEIGMFNNAKFGAPSIAAAGDLVLNELLFNPVGAGFDYVEMVNKSSKVIDLQTIYIAGKNSTGAINDPIQISSDHRLLMPGGYVVATRNETWLTQQYVVKDLSTICQTPAFPSMPDDKGYLAILNHQGEVIDEVAYSDKWHFALLNNKDGVALERLDYAQPTQEPTNWTSAASAAGFGTPGYQNSQFRSGGIAAGSFVIDDKIFSPDGDGHQDYVTIRYTMPEPGYMGSLSIYDLAGKPVRYLLKSGLLGLNGVVTWNGLNEMNNRLPVGQYIILMEIFNLKGKTQRFKGSVALVRRF